MPGNKVVSAFLDKTFKIVSSPETCGIIDWNRDGDSFIVKRPKAFSEKVLPQYFRHSKFSSFVRQLNFYGFHKLRTDETGMLSSGKIDQTQETGWWEFKHPFFQRGKPHLLTKIKRKTYSDEEKGDMERLRSDVDMLKEQVAELTRSVSSLTQLLASQKSDALPQQRSSRPAIELPQEVVGKKRKAKEMGPSNSGYDLTEDINTDLDRFMSLMELDWMFQPHQELTEETAQALTTPPSQDLPPVQPHLMPTKAVSGVKRTKIESELEACDLRLKQNPDDAGAASYKSLLLQHLSSLL